MCLKCKECKSENVEVTEKKIWADNKYIIIYQVYCKDCGYTSIRQ